MRDRPERVRDALAQGPVARHDEVQIADRLDQRVDVLLRRQPADVENLRRLRGRGDLVRDSNAVRDHDHVHSGRAYGSRNRLGDANHGSSGTQERAHEARPAARELDVGEAAGGTGAVQRDDERLAAEPRNRRGE